MNNTTQNSIKATHLIRQTPVILFARIAVLEATMCIVLLTWLFTHSYFSDPTTIWTVVALQAVHTIILIYLILSWTCHYYLFKNKQIILKKGIIWVKKEIYSLSILGHVHVEQGILGRIFHYGSINLMGPILDERASIRRIPTPDYYCSLIQQELAQERRSDTMIYDHGNSNHVIPTSTR